METVNVIEITDDDIIGIKSFELNSDGESAAKKRFQSLAIAKGAEEEEMPDFFNENYYESGSYQLYLAYSD